MRHRRAFRKLGRTMEHRKALRRNLAQSLFEHGQVTTTLQKAKDVRPFAERMITLAKKARSGDLACRRRLHQLLTERFFIARDHQEDYDAMSNARRQAVRCARSGRHYRTGQARGALPFTSQAISDRLINELAERFQDRNGGYTRIIKLARTRVGDQGLQAVLQLIGEEEVPSSVPKSTKSARQKRVDMRYAAVMTAGRRAAAVSDAGGSSSATSTTAAQGGEGVSTSSSAKDPASE